MNQSNHNPLDNDTSSSTLPVFENPPNGNTTDSEALTHAAQQTKEPFLSQTTEGNNSNKRLYTVLFILSSIPGMLYMGIHIFDAILSLKDPPATRSENQNLIEQMFGKDTWTLWAFLFVFISWFLIWRIFRTSANQSHKLFILILLVLFSIPVCIILFLLLFSVHPAVLFGFVSVITLIAKYRKDPWKSTDHIIKN